MSSRVWLFLLLVIGQLTSTAALADEKSVNKDLSISHPKGCLYGHFFGPGYSLVQPMGELTGHFNSPKYTFLGPQTIGVHQENHEYSHRMR